MRATRFFVSPWLTFGRRARLLSRCDRPEPGSSAKPDSRDYPCASSPKPAVSRDYPGVLTALSRGCPPAPSCRRRPQTLQVVVRALPRQEHMGEHGIEVEQDPPRVVVPVDGERSSVARLRRFHHPVRDSAHLAIGLAFADD